MVASIGHRQHGLPAPRDWQAEYSALAARDRHTPLEPEDLERLGLAAFLAGNESASLDANTRAHNLALERGDTRQAARAAVWVAFTLRGAHELQQAAGWVARARRLLEEDRHDCVECGYVTLMQALEQIASGDLPGAEPVIAASERIGERFGDADLSNLARQARGRVLVGLGRVAEGMTLFDEVMVAVTARGGDGHVSGGPRAGICASPGSDDRAVAFQRVQAPGPTPAW
jgi:hypothetical protein